MEEIKWISVAEYTKLKGYKSTQVVYNKIYTGKLKKNKDWKEEEITIKRKLLKA